MTDKIKSYVITSEASPNSAETLEVYKQDLTEDRSGEADTEIYCDCFDASLS